MQDARAVGRQLNAGADLAELAGLLEHRDFVAVFGETQGRGESPIPAGDQHLSRRHQPISLGASTMGSTGRAAGCIMCSLPACPASTRAADDLHHAQPGHRSGISPAQESRRVQTFELSFGKAHVFYPEASKTLHGGIAPRCRSRRPRPRARLDIDRLRQRPAVSRVVVLERRHRGRVRQCLGGRCRDRPELVGKPLPLAAEVAALPCRSADDVRELFEPLGYEIDVEPRDGSSGTTATSPCRPARRWRNC